MSNATPTFLEQFFQLQLQESGDAPLPKRPIMKVVGATLVDDPVNGITTMTVDGGSGSGQANLTLASGLNSNVATDGSLLQSIAISGSAPALLGGIVPSAGVFAGKAIVFRDTSGKGIQVKNEDTSSAAANRFTTPNRRTYIVPPGSFGSFTAYYDTTADRFVITSNGAHIPTTAKVDDFFSVIDTDDSASFFRAFAYAATTGVPLNLELLGRTYTISSPLLLNLLTGMAIHMRGQGGEGTQGAPVPSTIIRWAGAAGAVMFTIGGYISGSSGPIAGLNGSTFERIQFDGGALAGACVHQNANTTSLIWDQCTYANCAPAAPWQASNAYTLGQQRIVAASGTPGGSAYVPPDNQHLYQVTGVTGDGKSGSSPPSWPTTSGGTVTETTGGGSVTWTEVGPSPACFLVGSFDPLLFFCEGTTWRDCGFGGQATSVAGVITGGMAGWRALAGGNTKDFHFERPSFVECSVALDWYRGSGQLKVDAPRFADNAIDYIHGGGSLVVDCNESEGSNIFYLNNTTVGGATAVFDGGYWAGVTQGTGLSASLCFLSNQCWTINGMTLSDGNPSQPIPHLYAANIQSNPGSEQSAAFALEDVTFSFQDGLYSGPYIPPVVGASFGAYWSQGVPQTTTVGSVDYQVGYVNRMRVFNCIAQNNLHGYVYQFPNYLGSDLRVDEMGVSAGRGGTTSAGVVCITPGSLKGSCAVFQVPASAFSAAAHSKTLLLGVLLNKCVIKRVIASVTTAFGGGTAPTISVGYSVPFSSPSHVKVDGFILASSCTAVGGCPKAYGLASGDLGLALAAPVQGGAILWGPTTPGDEAGSEWVATVTLADAGNTSLITTGLVTIYIEYSPLPPWAALLGTADNPPLQASWASF